MHHMTAIVLVDIGLYLEPCLFIGHSSANIVSISLIDGIVTSSYVPRVLIATMAFVFTLLLFSVSRLRLDDVPRLVWRHVFILGASLCVVHVVE